MIFRLMPVLADLSIEILHFSMFSFSRSSDIDAKDAAMQSAAFDPEYFISVIR